eukprot:CAMPEP_0116898536 /NCGR_PEP_ID=MMETSP0467-20121206/7250_1 /TAXON_ID=283647 /ORGANISM="Mesodinium pulex, Strain SPMC105" /LENGTH=79 /DNA_ID=CAMNT_0004570745 /DNA_START=217 /DNA_END=456 /DNA_ORIENTATION=+
MNISILKEYKDFTLDEGKQSDINEVDFQFAEIECRSCSVDLDKLNDSEMLDSNQSQVRLDIEDSHNTHENVAIDDGWAF